MRMHSDRYGNSSNKKVKRNACKRIGTLDSKMHHKEAQPLLGTEESQLASELLNKVEDLLARLLKNEPMSLDSIANSLQLQTSPRQNHGWINLPLQESWLKTPSQSDISGFLLFPA